MRQRFGERAEGVWWDGTITRCLGLGEGKCKIGSVYGVGVHCILSGEAGATM